MTSEKGIQNVQMLLWPVNKRDGRHHCCLTLLSPGAHRALSSPAPCGGRDTSAVPANEMWAEALGPASRLEHETPAPGPPQFQRPCLGDCGGVSWWSLCQPGSLSDRSRQMHVGLVACVRSNFTVSSHWQYWSICYINIVFYPDRYKNAI